MAPDLLNDDGTASMATAFMMSHHAFRRDLGRYLRALEKGSPDPATMREEWQWYRNALHGHHTQEDTAIFPDMRQKHPATAATIDKLAAEHKRIDPLLEHGDAAFAGLPATRTDAVAVLRELSALLDPHLAREAAEIVPHLRDAKEFPAPPDEQTAAMYAQGFAWASNGIAADVLARVDEMLPALLREKLPAARAAYDAKAARQWPGEKPLASRTPASLLTPGH
ncbi:MAG: hemerythrin domain-containing protein [Alphaproteobacteria bacterium]|nr:hemerythrin domain-containing protein [Alphaproteobacteria bacterium]